jgi:malate dehydrogenase (quinone)
VLERCFGEEMKSSTWQSELKTMVRSFGEVLANDAELYQKERARADKALRIL